jgi:hypothetical protein
VEQNFTLTLNEHGLTRYHMLCRKCKKIGPEGRYMDEARKLAKEAGWKLEPWPRCSGCSGNEQPKGEPQNV